MLTAVGCRWVLIGHSERRQYFGETDETVAKKIGPALEAGLTPVVCVGEVLADVTVETNDLAILDRLVRDIRRFHADHHLAALFDLVERVGPSPSGEQQHHGSRKRASPHTANDQRPFHILFLL